MTALFCALTLFFGATESAFAFLRIPAAMQGAQPAVPATPTVSPAQPATPAAPALNRLANQRALWQELFAVRSRAEEKQAKINAVFALKMDADDTIVKIDGKLDALVDTVAQKLEENIGGTLYFKETRQWFEEDEPTVTENTVDGDFSLRIIGEDLYLNLKKLTIEGTDSADADELKQFLNTWFHVNMLEANGQSIWDEKAQTISGRELAINSPADLEAAFAKSLMMEGSLTRVQALRVARLFSLKRLFAITKTETAAEATYNLQIIPARLRMAFVGAAKITNEKMSADDIASLNDFLRKANLKIAVSVNKATGKVSTIKIDFTLKDFEDVKEIAVSLTINVLPWNPNYKIEVPADYKELEDAF